MRSGGLVGEVHPYVEKIALVKWLNREFGYQLLPGDLDGTKPALDEHELDWHFIYQTTFSDPDVRWIYESTEELDRAKARRFYKAFREKGILSAQIELPNPE